MFSYINCLRSWTLKEGDNLREYLHKNLVKYEKEVNPISSWPEGKTKICTYNTKVDGTSPVVLVINDSFPIGVLQGTSPNAYFLFDFDGDGILETKTNTAALPYWVVKITSINKTRNDNITKILDIIYQGFQNDNGPIASTISSMQAIDEYKSDVNFGNRDLVYLIYFYTAYSQKLREQSLAAISLLGDELKSRFNKEHPLILLYTIETYINLGQDDKAREVVKQLRKADPEFIPGMVYEYQLETDKEKAKALLEDLKMNHADHWIVEQI